MFWVLWVNLAVTCCITFLCFPFTLHLLSYCLLMWLSSFFFTYLTGLMFCITLSVLPAASHFSLFLAFHLAVWWFLQNLVAVLLLHFYITSVILSFVGTYLTRTFLVFISTFLICAYRLSHLHILCFLHLLYVILVLTILHFHNFY
jgi:hypothetical protein